MSILQKVFILNKYISSPTLLGKEIRRLVFKKAVNATVIEQQELYVVDFFFCAIIKSERNFSDLFQSTLKALGDDPDITPKYHCWVYLIYAMCLNREIKNLQQKGAQMDKIQPYFDEVVHILTQAEEYLPDHDQAALCANYIMFERAQLAYKLAKAEQKPYWNRAAQQLNPRLQEAIDLCEEIIGKDKFFIRALNLQGDIYTKLPLNENGGDFLNKAIEKYQCILDDKTETEFKEVYDQNVKIGDTFAHTHNGLGNVYRERDQFQEAITHYKKAIQVDSEFCYPYNYLGDCYRILGMYEEAKQNYQQAINLDKDFAFPYYGMGKIGYDFGKRYSQDEYNKYFQIAIAWFDKAISKNPVFGYAYLDKGRALERQGKHEEAQATYEKAIKKFDDRYAFWKSEAKKYFDEIAKKLGQEDEYRNQRETEGERIVGKTILERLENKVFHAKLSFTNSFLKEKAIELAEPEGYRNQDESVQYLEVLRKWNSYTPLVTGSRGGGYFIRVGKRGIVIDPGYNFVDSFRAMGHKFHEITDVFLTHSHDDHTANVEGILNLLYQYNKNLKDNAIPLYIGKKHNVAKTSVTENYTATKNTLYHRNKHKINLFLPSRTYEKLSGIVDYDPQSVCKMQFEQYGQGTGKELSICAHPDGPCSYRLVDCGENRVCPVQIVIKGFSYDFHSSGLVSIQSVKAKHKELYPEGPWDKGTSWGYLLKIADNDHATFIIFSGDTAWDEREMKAEYQRIGAMINQDAAATKYVIFVAHIGGFKEIEREGKYYDNHLGRLGLAQANGVLAPNLCLISEFGEEFKGVRSKIASIFQEASEQCNGNALFLSVDNNFRINLGKEPKVNVITDIDTTYSLHNPKAIKYGEVEPKAVKVGESELTDQLFYYRGDNLKLTEGLCIQALEGSGYRNVGGSQDIDLEWPDGSEIVGY